MLAICLAMLETEQDQRRFTRLFEAHEKKIYGVALHILGNPTQAEDAAQIGRASCRERVYVSV